MRSARYGIAGDHYELVITQAYGTIKSFAAESNDEKAAMEEIESFIASGVATLDDDQSWRVDFVRDNGNQTRTFVRELKGEQNRE